MSHPTRDQLLEGPCPCDRDGHSFTEMTAFGDSTRTFLCRCGVTAVEPLRRWPSDEDVSAMVLWA